MKKTQNILKFSFYIANFILIIFYLYPGSIFGCFLYNDCNIQPQITRNFIISSNHFYIFGIISTMGMLAYKKTKKIKLLILYLFFLSIILELFHFIIPNRGFEIGDLFGNIVGVAFVLIIYKIKYKHV